MSNPTRPGVIPIWTQGNTPVRTQPTNGEQFAGFNANFRPPAEWHNWLFGVTSDWIEWLDFVTNSAANFPVSNAGHNVATATTLQGQLDQLDAAFSSLGLLWCVPTGTVDGTNATFFLPQAPINLVSVLAFQDGLADAPAEFTIQHISGQYAVVFNAGFIPQPGQKPLALFMTGSSGVGVGGGIAAIQNDSGGVGLYDGQVVNTAKFKALKAGLNVTITDNMDGTVSIASTGGGGGGSPEVHGSAGAPTAIDPAVGIIPTTAIDQIWFVAPLSGSGAVPITASPAIGPGAVVGQRLKVKSPPVSGATPYLVIPNNSGTEQNGPCSMGSFGQAIDYTWDGTSWSEDSRRV